MKDLAKLIKDGKAVRFEVDNDCWTAFDAKGKKVAQDGEVTPRGDGGYGSGNCYGGDILQALADVVGVKIESV